MTDSKSLSDKVAELGQAIALRQNAYESYKEFKRVEDEIRYEVEIALDNAGLKSAKAKDYTASMVPKPRIIVKNEHEVMDWIKAEPDIESDQYIGLKNSQFQVLAKSILKGTGEYIPGTEVVIKESLAIRSNKKKEK
jgi:hypothetical protein